MREYTERNYQKGFTLTELMIVVAILGILTAIAIPSYQGARKRQYESSAKENLRVISMALENYYIFNGRYPPNESALFTESPAYLNRRYNDSTVNNYKYKYTLGVQGRQYAVDARWTDAADSQATNFRVATGGIMTSASNNTEPTNAEGLQ